MLLIYKYIKKQQKLDLKRGIMKYFIVTYGCQMNVHESEKIAGILEGLGYSEAEKREDADIIVFKIVSHHFSHCRFLWAFFFLAIK